MPEVNVDAMNIHLAKIGRSVSVGAIAVPILDGAGWHNSPRLEMPDNIVPLRLPPYAPELNPAENIWAYLRGNQLSNRLYRSYEDIVDACCDAWNALMRRPDVIRSIGNREYAQERIQGRWYYRAAALYSSTRGLTGMPAARGLHAVSPRKADCGHGGKATCQGCPAPRPLDTDCEARCDVGNRARIALDGEFCRKAIVAAIRPL